MRLALLLICLFFALVSTAQKRVQLDTSVVDARSFNKATLNELREDKAFQYENIKEPPKSLWDRFWSWVWYKITQLLSTKEGQRTLNVLLILFGVAMIAFFIVKVMGMNKDGLLGRSSKETLDYTVSSDSIHNISFEDAIQEAVAMGNYRLAIRLLYLQTLKKLSDKSFIDWKINKTNSDYLQEVSNQRWAGTFRSLTYNFDYTWYGEVPVNRERFETVQQEFTSFNNQL